MQPYDQRLDALLAAAAKTFAERGYHATSMRDLARASGFSLAGMYHYVESKEALLFEIQDRCFAQVLEGARAALEAATGPESRLRAFIQHHVIFFAAHMDEMKVLAHEEAELTGTMRAQLRRRKKEYVGLLEELLGDVPGTHADPHIAAYALFGMMNWIYTWYHPAGPASPATLAEELASLFLDGYIAAHPATARLVATHGG
ncbi:MAG: TetR/AcrR family transcriptional regulator [Gemmatimonadales bacterium]